MSPSSGGLSVLRFSPPFPTGRGRGRLAVAPSTAKGSPLADSVNREVFLAAAGPQHLLRHRAARRTATCTSPPTSPARSASTTSTAISCARSWTRPVFTGLPIATGNPQSLAVDPGRARSTTPTSTCRVRCPMLDTGPNGKVWRITFRREQRPEPARDRAPEPGVSPTASPSSRVTSSR